jgi:hypothetical protein
MRAKCEPDITIDLSQLDRLSAILHDVSSRRAEIRITYNSNNGPIIQVVPVD